MATVNVIKPTFKIFAPTAEPIEKIAEMARICYRSESAAGEEADARLVRGCTKRGHTSVLEHGYASLYVSDTLTVKPEDLPGANLKMAITPAQIWENFQSEDRRKYMTIFGDESIYKVIDGPNAPQKLYKVDVANLRAWHNIIDQFLVVSFEQKTAMGTAFIIGILEAFYEKYPVVFQDIIDKLNEALATADTDHYLFKIFGQNLKEGEKLTYHSFDVWSDKFGFVVSNASPRFSLSVKVRINRATTHQIVRHRRDVGYSQESQRYVNYEGKGFEVIHPSIDVVKYANYRFLTKNGKKLPLDPGGFIPVGSIKYEKWLASQSRACDDYLALLSDEDDSIVKITDEGEVRVGLPPETARGDLTNDFATTIGITWTIQTFVNMVYWRLEEHAQWPFRCFVGRVIIEGLKKQHDFFENFPPKTIAVWLDKCVKMGIASQDEIKPLMKVQEKRQNNINQIVIQKQKEFEEAQKRAQRKAVLAAKAKELERMKPQMPAEQGATPPEEEKK